VEISVEKEGCYITTIKSDNPLFKAHQACIGDENVPCFRAIHGNFCPGLHPLFTVRLAIYAAIRDLLSVIWHIFPDCAGLQMQSFRIHATRCSAILPFLTLLSTHDPVHFHKCNSRHFYHDIVIPAIHTPLMMTDHTRQLVSKCHTRQFVSKCHATHCAARQAKNKLPCNNENKQMIART
jgi:hypothetical protein